MIIGFAGRMRSGKTELARVCEENGYKRLYFALPLKELCAELLGMTVDELNEAKNSRRTLNVELGEEQFRIIEDATNIQYDDIRRTCSGRMITDARDMLQFIGTDLIRKFDNDWHVNKIRSMLSDDHDYVIDDVRFHNEKAMIESLGGDCWFVIRPTVDNISNHEAETSVKWQDFYNRLIINDSTLTMLQFKWEAFVSNYNRSTTMREEEFNKILEHGNGDRIEPMSIRDMLFLSDAFFTYVPKTPRGKRVIRYSMEQNRSLIVTYEKNEVDIVTNPLNIEDYKMVLC